MTTYTATFANQQRVQPHTWQTQSWASAVRRAGRHWVLSRHIDRFCDPLTVEGQEHLDGLRGPLIIMPNHSSHMDTPVALSVLPERIRSRTAVAAAADKFYRPGKRGWWFSLFYNAFPIERGGGSGALDYSVSLLRRGWSIVMYPEGTRSQDSEIAPFHHGVSILAMQAGVPVIPIYMEGLRNVMPKGQRSPRPAAVEVRIGEPIAVERGTPVPQATITLERAMREIAGGHTMLMAV
jgi:1-acyl-sn-glycerol-3-phosphate acyltransferase